MQNADFFTNPNYFYVQVTPEIAKELLETYELNWIFDNRFDSFYEVLKESLERHERHHSQKREF